MKSDFFISTEKNLAEAHIDYIEPFWEQHVQHGTFSTPDKVLIAYAFVIHPQPMGAVVISSGRTETYLKYKEVLYEFYQNGYSVFILDHRGQGLSGRMTVNHQLGFVESFSDYVADFDLFMQLIVLPFGNPKVDLLCHSMGSVIGALYCLAYPDRFSKIIFSAPMFGIRPVLPPFFTDLLVKTHFLLKKLSGHKDSYFFGQKDYVQTLFSDNELTHSEVRYAVFKEVYKTDATLKLGGVSGHWLRAATFAMDRVEQQATTFKLPSLVLQAGGDKIVDNQRQTIVATKMPSCELYIIADAKHELLIEADRFRLPAMEKIFAFLNG